MSSEQYVNDRCLGNPQVVGNALTCCRVHLDCGFPSRGFPCRGGGPASCYRIGLGIQRDVDAYRRNLDVCGAHFGEHCPRSSVTRTCPDYATLAPTHLAHQQPPRQRPAVNSARLTIGASDSHAQ